MTTLDELCIEIERACQEVEQLLARIARIKELAQDLDHDAEDHA